MSVLAASTLVRRMWQFNTSLWFLWDRPHGCNVSVMVIIFGTECCVYSSTHLCFVKGDVLKTTRRRRNEKHRHRREEETRMLPSTGPLIFYKSSKTPFPNLFPQQKVSNYFSVWFKFSCLLEISWASFLKEKKIPNQQKKKGVQATNLYYVVLLCMALSSARSFLKDGLFLGSYCQQLLIILEISTGQPCGAGIRYPETHHRQSNR